MFENITFDLKQRKLLSPSYSVYSDLTSNKILVQTGNFDILDQICIKRVLWVLSLEKRKSKYHDRIQRIRITLYTKFDLKQKILFFLDEICLKEVLTVLIDSQNTGVSNNKKNWK